MVIRGVFNGLDFTNCWNYRCDCILVLCIGIVVVLISVKKNLDHVAKTLDGVEGQVQVLLVKQLIYFTKLIA